MKPSLKKVAWYIASTTLLVVFLIVGNLAKAEDVNRLSWVVNTVGVAVVVETDSDNKFAAVAKCGGESILFLYDLKNYKPSDIGKVLSVKLRVDRNSIKTTYGTLTEDDDNVALVIEGGNELIPNMKRGSHLRVAFRSEDSSEYNIVEKYNLAGFTSAFSRSKDFCAQEVMEYFPDDGDFF